MDGTIRAEERSLLEEIHGSVSNLIGIIRTYETKSKIPELFASPLLKLRQEEAKAVVGHAVSRLSVGLAALCQRPVGFAASLFCDAYLNSPSE